MSEGRQSRLEALRKREDVKSSLVNNLADRYKQAGKKVGAAEEAVIQAEVEKMLKEAKPSVDQLERLESHVKTMSRQNTPAGSRVGTPKCQPPGSMSGRSHLDEPSLAGAAARNKLDPWAKMALADVEKYHGEEAAKVEKKKRVIAAQRQYLDAQIAEKESQNVAAKDAKAADKATIMEQYEQYMKDEEAVKKVNKDKMLQSKADQDKQCEDIARAAEAADQLEKQQDQQMLHKALADAEAARAKERANFKKRLEAAAALTALNAQNTQFKAKEAEKEEALNVKLMEEYAALLDKQEEERQAALQKIHDKQAAQGASAEGMQAKIAAKLKAETDMRTREQEYANYKADEMAAQKKQASEKRKGEMLLSLSQQIEDKEAKAEVERIATIQFVKDFTDKVAMLEKVDRDAAAKRKQAAKDNNQVVKQQISTHVSAKVTAPAMTKVEQKINKKGLAGLGVFGTPAPSRLGTPRTGSRTGTPSRRTK